MRKINEIIVHCSDTPSDMAVDAALIRKWHTEERGWGDIGYHYVILRDGTIEKGRHDVIVGAHARGHNQHSIGICLVGGMPRANFTMQQYSALFQLVADIRNEHGPVGISGHYEYDEDKGCPMFDVKALLGLN